MAGSDGAAVIFCLSQIHTGTVSVLAWLGAHEDCDGILLSTEVYESGREPATVYHEHVRPDDREPRKIARSQVVLAWAHPTIIPLRDPLAALVSYHNRALVTGQVGTDLFRPVVDVVDRWLLLAETEERFEDFPNIRYLAWDLPELESRRPDREGARMRSAGLWAAAQAVGLTDPAPSRAGLPRENSSGAYRLREAYEAGDLEGLRILRGVGHLIDAEKILRPFLERRGYRDLLWWS